MNINVRCWNLSLYQSDLLVVLTGTLSSNFSVSALTKQSLKTKYLSTISIRQHLTQRKMHVISSEEKQYEIIYNLFQ